MQQGLLEYRESAECWRQALATFPSENLTPTEQQQKQHCEYELETALNRVSLAEEAKLVPMGREFLGMMPWDRVKAMEAELQAGLPGSAKSSVSRHTRTLLSYPDSRLTQAWVMLRASKVCKTVDLVSVDHLLLGRFVSCGIPPQRT